jgi:ankyrin repeat protein
MFIQKPSQETIDEFVGNAHGNLVRVEELISDYPDIVDAKASFDETALQAAAQMGREDIANFLLSHGAVMDIFGASMLGDVKRVREFLERDRNRANAPGGHGFPPLYYAAVKNRIEIAEVLLRNGANVNMGEGSNTALHAAALNGQAEFALWLLNHGAHVNALDYEGKTPLAIAEKAGQSKLVELLRKNGGEI